MLESFVHWCIDIANRKLTELWYKLTGARLSFILDPLFYTPIDSRFKQEIAASPMWSTNSLAEKLLTVAGVCAHPSIAAGRFELDASISRMYLIDGYALMCTAAGGPSYTYGRGNTVLTKEHLATAPLPMGWYLVTNDERLRFVALARERDALQATQLNLYFSACRQYEIASKLVDCCAPVDDLCSICLDDSGDEWKKLPACGHKFHKNCITRISHQTCPLCRAAF